MLGLPDIMPVFSAALLQYWDISFYLKIIGSNRFMSLHFFLPTISIVACFDLILYESRCVLISDCTSNGSN